MSFFSKLYTIIVHYKRFGFAGIRLLLQKKFRNKSCIKFSNPEYQYPIFLRNDTSDIQIFYQILFNKSYNFFYDTEPDVIFDLGANIGLASVYFTNKYPKTRIIAVEPERSNFDLLLKNTKNYDNISCYNNGIWYKKAFLEIEDNKADNWEYKVRETDNPNASSIKAITIDDLMNKLKINKIDILKIDIEGSEKELFEKNYECWLPKVNVIVIELHDRMRDYSSKSFFKALVNYNFSLSIQGENLICFMKY
jgi:FkbM family methyltransferase